MKTIVVVALAMLALIGVALSEETTAAKQVIKRDTDLRLGTYKDKAANKCAKYDPYNWELFTPDGGCMPTYDATTNKCLSVHKVVLLAKTNTVRVRYYSCEDQDCLGKPIKGKTADWTLDVCRNHKMLTLIK